MGAGCYYTLNEDREYRAYWLDVGYSEDEFDTLYEDEVLNLMACILEHPKCEEASSNTALYGEMFKVVLEPNYYSSGIVINFEYEPVDERQEGLQRHLYTKCYQTLIRHINKDYPLRIATSGYTYGTIEIGQAA